MTFSDQSQQVAVRPFSSSHAQEASQSTRSTEGSRSLDPSASPIGNGATQILYSGVLITINDLAGTFVNGNTLSQAVTLLHELGHAYDDMYGPGSTLIQSDSTSTAQSMANTALVQQKCFK
jgi:hypothetical protein